MEQGSDITPIGITDWRNLRIRFGIRDRDRLAHMYCLGKTGTGKSTLLENMAIADLRRKKGVAVIDPHGDIAEHILHYVPEARIDEVVYFNLADQEYAIGFNPIGRISPQFHHLVASSLIATFKKIWSDSWGTRLEHILRFSLLTLLEYQDATLLDIQPLLTDAEYRANVLKRVTSPHLRSFWGNEHGKGTAGFRAESISPILNKLGILVASSALRHTFGQRRQVFSMQQVLDEGKILIVNLSKGAIGEDACALLGSVLVSAIQHAALFRAGQDAAARKPFYLYVDEMHSFVSLSFADILSESRKYGLSLFLAHQYIDQLHPQVQSAVFGNVGTVISFRAGAADARYLAKEFSPVFGESDIIHLPKHSMYIKLMIDGATSIPFSATTLPLAQQAASCKRAVIAASRARYGNAKEAVEKSIAYRHQQPAPRNDTLF